MNELYDVLRAATEDDVDRVLIGLRGEDLFQLDAPSADLLEFFNRMIDELTGKRATAEEIDDLNIAAAAARGTD